jgi:hypothetical protein
LAERDGGGGLCCAVPVAVRRRRVRRAALLVFPCFLKLAPPPLANDLTHRHNKERRHEAIAFCFLVTNGILDFSLPRPPRPRAHDAEKKKNTRSTSSSIPS